MDSLKKIENILFNIYFFKNNIIYLYKKNTINFLEKKFVVIEKIKFKIP